MLKQASQCCTSELIPSSQSSLTRCWTTAPPRPCLLCWTWTYGPWTTEPWHPDIPVPTHSTVVESSDTFIPSSVLTAACIELHDDTHPNMGHIVWCFSVLEGVESSHRQPRLVTWDFYVYDHLKRVLLKQCQFGHMSRPHWWSGSSSLAEEIHQLVQQCDACLIAHRGFFNGVYSFAQNNCEIGVIWLIY